MTIIYFVLIFGLVVVAHEFGHFLLAKANGIHVIEFAVGMGPKLLHFKKGETEYCLRLLPIGGACIFENEDELGGVKTVFMRRVPFLQRVFGPEFLRL